MRLFASVRGSVIWIAAFLGVISWVWVGVYDLTALNDAYEGMLLGVSKWNRSIFGENEHRRSHSQDYEPIVLQGAAWRVAQGSGVRQNAPTRLIDMAFQTNTPSSVRKVSILLDGQRRHAIMGVVPFSFSYNLRVSTDTHLWLGVNHEGSDSAMNKLRFAVQVENEAKRNRLFDIWLPSDHTGWRDETVDLRAFAGQDVKIHFSVSMVDPTDPGSGASRGSVRAYWSDLFLGSLAESSRPPNIFLILIDTLRADHLSSYGYERPTSPNIDKLAAEGVRFEKAFSAAPWTDPSVLALFTGLYPSDVWEPKPHVEAIQEVLPPHVDTLAEILSARGYFTIAASDHPGINAGRFGQGFNIYSHLYHEDGPYIGWRETSGEQLLRRLHMLLAGRPRRGLFTYVHLIYPHVPYASPPPYDAYFGPGTDQIDFTNKAGVVNMYDGEIRRTDDVVGNILTDIRRLKLADDSIIIILSDHGEGFWEHGLFEHGNSLYNELLHIPLIFHSPGRIPAGTIVREVVGIVDILPTILDLVDIEALRDYRGISLLPLMEGKEALPRLAFSEFPHTRIIRGRAIQSLAEKLIMPNEGDHPFEYYRVAEDPQELRRLSGDPSARISDLTGRIEDISRGATGRRAAFPLAQQKPSEDMVRRLKSLGYIK